MPRSSKRRGRPRANRVDRYLGGTVYDEVGTAFSEGPDISRHQAQALVRRGCRLAVHPDQRGLTWYGQAEALEWLSDQSAFLSDSSDHYPGADPHGLYWDLTLYQADIGTRLVIAHGSCS